MFAVEQSADLREGGAGGGFAGYDHFVGLGEVVPDEGLYVGFDDDVGLGAPGKIGVTLNDVEGAAENVREGARFFEITGFEINGDDHVGAEEEGAFYRDRGGEKAVNEGAAFELDRHEETGIGAGSAHRRADKSAGIIDGNAGADIGGGNG